LVAVPIFLGHENAVYFVRILHKATLSRIDLKGLVLNLDFGQNIAINLVYDSTYLIKE